MNFKWDLKKQIDEVRAFVQEINIVNFDDLSYNDAFYIHKILKLESIREIGTLQIQNFINTMSGFDGRERYEKFLINLLKKKER